MYELSVISDNKNLIINIYFSEDIQKEYVRRIDVLLRPLGFYKPRNDYHFYYNETLEYSQNILGRIQDIFSNINKYDKNIKYIEFIDEDEYVDIKIKQSSDKIFNEYYV